MADPQNINPYSGNAVPTFDILDKIVTLLGATKLSFYPLLVGSTGVTALGEEQFVYGAGSASPVGTGSQLYYAHNAGLVGADVMAPVRHIGGVYSYNCTPVNNQYHLVAGSEGGALDQAAHSFVTGGLDDAFSLGLWVLLHEPLGTVRSLISKYRTTAATAREYDLRFSATGKLIMELYDEDAAASEIATSVGTALVPFTWQFVTMTYDGGQAAPVINLYLNGVSVHDGSSVEAGAYISMEDLTTPLLIGARDITTAVAQNLNGRVALPFITGKELSADDVRSIYHYGRMLLGLD